MNLHPEQDIKAVLIAKDERSQIFDFIFSAQALAACPEDVIPYPADKIRVVRERSILPVSGAHYDRLIITTSVFERPVRITFDYESGCTYIDDKPVINAYSKGFLYNEHPLFQYKSFFDNSGFKAHLCSMHGLVPEDVRDQITHPHVNMNTFRLLAYNNLLRNYPHELFEQFTEEVRPGLINLIALEAELRDFKKIDKTLRRHGIYPSERIKKILFADQKLFETLYYATTSEEPFMFTSEPLQYKFFSLDNAASILGSIYFEGYDFEGAQDLWHTAFQVCGEVKMLEAFTSGLLDCEKLTIENSMTTYAKATRTRYDFWGNDHLVFPLVHSTELLSELTGKSVTLIMSTFRYYCFEEMLWPGVLDAPIHITEAERKLEFETDRFIFRFPETPRELISTGIDLADARHYNGLENCLLEQITEDLGPQIVFGNTKCLLIYDAADAGTRVGCVLFTPKGKPSLSFGDTYSIENPLEVTIDKNWISYNPDTIDRVKSKIVDDVRAQITKASTCPDLSKVERRKSREEMKALVTQEMLDRMQEAVKEA